MSVYLFKSNIARHTCIIIVWLDFSLEASIDVADRGQIDLADGVSACS